VIGSRGKAEQQAKDQHIASWDDDIQIILKRKDKRPQNSLLIGWEREVK
jgi:phosphorylcholine metabolism protein LicD